MKCSLLAGMPGEVDGIAMYFSEKSEKTKVVVTSNESSSKAAGATRIMHFWLPADLKQSQYKQPILFNSVIDDEIGNNHMIYQLFIVSF